MPTCCVKNCTSSSRIPGLSFHRFPKEREIEWKRAIGQPQLKVSENDRVCSLHFDENDYLPSYTNRRLLKSGAIPSQLFPEVHFKRKLEFPEEPVAGGSRVREENVLESPLIPMSSSSSTSTGSNDVQAGATDTFIEPQILREKTKRTFSTSSSSDQSDQRRLLKREHSYSQSPSKEKQKLIVKKQAIIRLKSKLNASRQKVKRLKRNVSLKNLVFNLKKEARMSTDAATMLESTFSGIPQILMKRLLLNTRRGKNTRKPYPDELKNFAMTLQFYSPKAYNYVRTTFKFALPAPSVIRSWLSKVDCEPGYSKPALNTLKKLVDEQPHPVLCSLLFDEISIKKQLDAEGPGLNVRGYVDVGTGAQDDCSLAVEAFVVMVVCVNGHWKLPIAYFLINKLSADEKAGIITECLRLLYEIKVTVLSVTCDGPQVNFAMANELGCKFTLEEGMVIWFSHPCDGSKICMIYDVCHMLKLIRNNWARLGQIKDPKGQIIDWRYIVRLFQIQEKEGLKLGNKLGKLHINWTKAAMKVNLAGQTLSESVATAIEFLKNDMELPEFQDAGPTIEFIRLINNLFDLLNSRNPLAMGYKGPLREASENYRRPFLNHALTYLYNCTNMDNTPLYRTKNRTPFIGFVISIISFLTIYEDYAKNPKTEKQLKYILTYKFFQDHLELFFCAVRARNGMNNNPTCSQFISTYKRLLMHTTIHHHGGNCTAQDNTTIVHRITSSTNVENIGISNVGNHRLRNVGSQVVCTEDDLTDIPQIRLNCVVENILAYMSGFVVRMAIRRLKCETCVMALFNEEKNLPSFKFRNLKNKGGLIHPSESVVKICKTTELTIRNSIL